MSVKIAGLMTMKIDTRGELDIAIIGLTRSGSLRACEAADARWEQISRNDDGTGYLEIPYSKANRRGQSEIVHINRQAMADLERIRPPGVTTGSIFGLKAASISRRIGAAAEAAGLGTGFTGHSCRVGMTVDLAKPKPRWDVHLPEVGDRAGSLAGGIRPLIAGPCGSGA